jgi:hypothetical protein
MAFQQANRYELSGSGIEGSVDTSSFGGGPVVNLTLDGEPVENAEFNRTSEGIEVTATTRVVPDGWTTSLRLVLPDVNLAGPEDQAAGGEVQVEDGAGDGDAAPDSYDSGLAGDQVGGYAVVVTARTSIGGPGLVRGALQLYDVRQVTATASVVDF